MYHITNLNTIISNNEINNIRSFLKNSKWNYKLPGGFVTNFPQRKVNTYGNGKYINKYGNLEGFGWKETYWTAKQTQNNVSIATTTEDLPKSLCSIVPKLKKYLDNIQPNNTLNDYSFNIAVCNNYTEPSMNICSHTDDDFWYPKEVNNRPMFISLTFYLDGIPEKDEYYSRFQINLNNKWIDLKLEDNSILFMNSDIYHRVLKFKKKNEKHFKPRINITLRSTYPLHINPLLHNICVANHTRYYRNPKYIISDGTIQKDKIDDLLLHYNNFCKNNQYKNIYHKVNKSHNMKKKFIHIYNTLSLNSNLIPYTNIRNNIVTESIIMTCYYIKYHLI